MMRSRLRPFAPLAWRFVPARRALSTLPTARYEAWRFVSARRALSTLPTARYEALVSSGKLTRDPHQLAALSALDRVWRELDGYAVPDVKEEAVALESEASGASLTQRVASVASSLTESLGLGTLAFGGGSDRPSGAGGPRVSRFGSNYDYDGEAAEAAKNKPAAAAPVLLGLDSKAPVGVYVHGGVGCGKTFVMDLFFDVAPVASKQRVHFHAMMLSVHRKLDALRRREGPPHPNPMRAVALDVLGDGVLLCFDEFQVTDIADALVMKALFEHLFDCGAVVVATSNRAPGELYENGVQRQVFAPLIPLLEARCQTVSLVASPTDYRLVQGAAASANVWFLDGDDAGFDEATKRLTKSADRVVSLSLHIPGSKRLVPVARAMLASRACFFTFDELCAGRLGFADYHALAQTFDTVFVEDVPLLRAGMMDATRRFITLIDALYEHGVKVVCKAAAPPRELYVVDAADQAALDRANLDVIGGDATYQMTADKRDEAFAFDRTVSRLIEMGSLSYVKRAPAHAAHVPEPDDLSDAEIDELFAHIDVDRSGSLSVDELHAFLSEISHLRRGHRNVGDGELAYALAQLDVSGHGVVCKDDLAAFLRALPSHGWGSLLPQVPESAAAALSRAAAR